MTNETNNRIRKILFNEISLVASLFAIAFGAFLWITKPAQDTALLDQRVQMIEENHIPHLEEAIEKLIEKDAKQDKLIHEIDIKLERIITILEK